MSPTRKNANADVFTLRSVLLGKDVSYSAVFPDNHGSADLPILYLLHGLFGSHENWLTNTDIAQYSTEFPFVIVCPDGGDSWYADSPYKRDHYYESHLLNELMPSAEERFHAGGRRSQRAIAGLSMGGYGAFKIAFRRPEMFCFAASMSGAFHAAEVTAGDPWTELQPSLLEVFRDDACLRMENDLFAMAEAFEPERIGGLPFFHFDCGIEDTFLPVNRRFGDVLDRRGIPHKFEIFPGGHDWIYWDLHLKSIFHVAEQFFKKAHLNI